MEATKQKRARSRSQSKSKALSSSPSLEAAVVDVDVEVEGGARRSSVRIAATATAKPKRKSVAKTVAKPKAKSVGKSDAKPDAKPDAKKTRSRSRSRSKSKSKSKFKSTASRKSSLGGGSWPDPLPQGFPPEFSVFGPAGFPPDYGQYGPTGYPPASDTMPAAWPGYPFNAYPGYPPSAGPPPYLYHQQQHQNQQQQFQQHMSASSLRDDSKSAKSRKSGGTASPSSYFDADSDASEDDSGKRSSAGSGAKDLDSTELSIPFMIAHRELKTITKGVFTVAAYPHFFPVCYHDEDGKLQGLDVDVMRGCAKLAGLKLKFVEFNTFDKIWDKPAKRIADTSIGGIANSKGRGGPETTWSFPYFYVGRSAMSRKADPIKKFPQDVHGVIVGTMGSTGWVDGELRLKRAHKEKAMIKGTTDEEDIQALEDGRIQGVMRGDFVSRAILKSHPDLTMTTWKADTSIIPKDGEIFAYPARVDSGVATMLSVYITYMIDTGGLEELMEKHGLA